MIFYFQILAGILLCICLFLYWLYARSGLKIQGLELDLHKKDLQIEKLEQINLYKEQTLESYKNTLAVEFENISQKTTQTQSEIFFKKTQQIFELEKQKASQLSNFQEERLLNHLTPLQKTLGEYQTQLVSYQKNKDRLFGQLENEIQKIHESHLNLSKQTVHLKDALRKPHVRGRWGEVQLKNCLEMAGMSNYADYSLQDSVTGDEGQSLRPDLIVQLPNQKKVIIDAKTPIDAFLDSIDAKTPEEQKSALDRMAKHLRKHIQQLATKAYHNSYEGSADFTLLFLPNESFLYACLESDPKVIEYAIEKKIFITTPPTLVAFLRVIEQAWGEQKINDNSKEVMSLGIELHKRLSDFSEHFARLGAQLKSSWLSYEKSWGSFEKRVLPQAKRMEEFNAKSHKPLTETSASLDL